MSGHLPFPSTKDIRAQQTVLLRRLLRELPGHNAFYSDRIRRSKAEADSVTLEEFARQFPFCTKVDFAADQEATPPFGTNLTQPLGDYSRCHQTSGTSGRIIRWLDTPESWSGMVDQWAEVLRAASVERGDRVYCAFSFGPFLGFWLAFEAAGRLGCLCLPGGGLGSSARVRSIVESGATVLCATPTYAIRLGELALAEGAKLAGSKVRLIVVAGEPGGSVQATRDRIRTLWNGARVFDHHGMTEVGPVTYECPENPLRLHVMEAAFLAEIVDPTTGEPVPPGIAGELVLTTLRRNASPALRYRTGDLVRERCRAGSQPGGDDPSGSVCECGRSELALEGGILGRCDDMVVVRGVNVYPSAAESLIRVESEVAEYRVRILSRQSMLEMEIDLEPTGTCEDAAALAERVIARFRERLALRVSVQIIPEGGLPRFEMKANRWFKL